MSQEITLDALANRSNSNPVDANASYHTVDVEVAPDLARISAQAESIDLLDSQAIAVYGEQSYRDMLAYGQQLLAHVRTNDFAGIDTKLSQLANLVKNLNVEQMNDGGVLSRLPFLKRPGSNIKGFEKRFGAALEQSAQAEAELVELATALREDKAVYDELLRTKAPLLSKLSLDVKAAEQMLSGARDVTLPQLEAEAEVSENDQSKHLVDDYRQRVMSFSTQVDDLQNTEKVFSKVAPHVVSVQANNLQLADKITQITGKIIPYWKSQIALAISMVKEQELLKQKREVLKRAQKQSGGEEYGAASHAEDLQLVDLDAVRKINNNLLSTIADAAMLQRTGQAVRLDTEATLLRLDGRVRQAMITAAAFGDEIVPEPVISGTKAEPELERFEEAEDIPDASDNADLLEDDELAELEDQHLADDIAWGERVESEAPWDAITVDDVHEELAEDLEPAPDFPVTQDIPGEETPAEDTWAKDVSAANSWTDNLWAKHVPAEEAPAEDTWTKDAPPEDTWTEDTPAEDTWAGDAPAEDAPPEEPPETEDKGGEYS